MKGRSTDTLRGDAVITVVIPAYNEAQILAATLGAIAFASGDIETIVVDAGSIDQTVAIAQAAGCTVLASGRKQRAYQMNIGAAAAVGDVLLFLHADTLLPKGALPSIIAALENPAVGGGAFSRRYDSRSTLLAITCWLARLRNRWFGWHLGDQAMFVRRDLFLSLGGFVERDLFEDLDFSRRLAARARVVTLDPPVTSSGRRFGTLGPLATTCHDVSLTWQYFAHEILPALLNRRKARDIPDLPPPTPHLRELRK